MDNMEALKGMYNTILHLSEMDKVLERHKEDVPVGIKKDTTELWKTLQALYSDDQAHALAIAGCIINQLVAGEDFHSLLHFLFYNTDFCFSPVLCNDGVRNAIYVHHATYIRNMTKDLLSFSRCIDAPMNDFKMNIDLGNGVEEDLIKSLAYTSCFCRVVPGFRFSWFNYNDQLLGLIQKIFPEAPILSKECVKQFVTDDISKATIKVNSRENENFILLSFNEEEKKILLKLSDADLYNIFYIFALVTELQHISSAAPPGFEGIDIGNSTANVKKTTLL